MTKPVCRAHHKPGRRVEQFDAWRLADLLAVRCATTCTGWQLRSSEIADWLGQHRATIVRWRRELDFPPPSGTCPVPRMKGKGRAYWWHARDVLGWLRRTGRLIEAT